LNTSEPYTLGHGAGVFIHGDPDELIRHVLNSIKELGISDFIEPSAKPFGLQLALRRDLTQTWMPGNDTTQLRLLWDHDVDHPGTNLEQEIWIAMMGSPKSFTYPSYAEFVSSIRIRRNISSAARKTQLAFHTTALERPKTYWAYDEEAGFTVLPNRPLIDALMMATQPQERTEPYAFSCYRATEYVMLLGIAQELEEVNPSLYSKLQVRCERKAIKSAEFHDTFLYEYGSMVEPVPANYYVPGDRLWFRNPDVRSSDVSGYEGSWVIYLGGGQFSNFWKPDSPYTLPSKCAEMFHWRDALYQDSQGELRIDEARVQELTQKTLSDADALTKIIGEMARLRDPLGVYANGGMLDASRECSRRVCPGTSDIQLG
jgi:hypothetical protein